LPCWRATDTCCKARDCASLVTALTRLPMSAKKSRALLLPMAPAVSITTATKWCVRTKSRYFAFFLSSANAATAPASLVAWARCDTAKVSVHVAIPIILFYNFVKKINIVMQCLISRVAYVLNDYLCSYTYTTWASQHSIIHPTQQFISIHLALSARDLAGLYSWQLLFNTIFNFNYFFHVLWSPTEL